MTLTEEQIADKNIGIAPVLTFEQVEQNIQELEAMYASWPASYQVHIPDNTELYALMRSTFRDNQDAGDYLSNKKKLESNISLASELNLDATLFQQQLDLLLNTRKRFFVIQSETEDPKNKDLIQAFTYAASAYDRNEPRQTNYWLDVYTLVNENNYTLGDATQQLITLRTDSYLSYQGEVKYKQALSRLQVLPNNIQMLESRLTSAPSYQRSGIQRSIDRSRAELVDYQEQLDAMQPYIDQGDYIGAFLEWEVIENVQTQEALAEKQRLQDLIDKQAQETEAVNALRADLPGFVDMLTQGQYPFFNKTLITYAILRIYYLLESEAAKLNKIIVVDKNIRVAPYVEARNAALLKLNEWQNSQAIAAAYLYHVYAGENVDSWTTLEGMGVRLNFEQMPSKISTILRTTSLGLSLNPAQPKTFEVMRVLPDGSLTPYFMVDAAKDLGLVSYSASDMAAQGQGTTDAKKEIDNYFNSLISDRDQKQNELDNFIEFQESLYPTQELIDPGYGSFKFVKGAEEDNIKYALQVISYLGTFNDLPDNLDSDIVYGKSNAKKGSSDLARILGLADYTHEEVLADIKAYYIEKVFMDKYQSQFLIEYENAKQEIEVQKMNMQLESTNLIIETSQRADMVKNQFAQMGLQISQLLLTEELYSKINKQTMSGAMGQTESTFEIPETEIADTTIQSDSTLTTGEQSVKFESNSQIELPVGLGKGSINVEFEGASNIELVTTATATIVKFDKNDIGSVLNTVGALSSFLPGAGPLIGGVLGTLGGLFGSKGKEAAERQRQFQQFQIKSLQFISNGIVKIQENLAIIYENLSAQLDEISGTLKIDKESLNALAQRVRLQIEELFRTEMDLAMNEIVLDGFNQTEEIWNGAKLAGLQILNDIIEQYARRLQELAQGINPEDLLPLLGLLPAAFIPGDDDETAGAMTNANILPVDETPGEKKSWWWLWLLIILILTGGGYSVYRYRQQK